MAEVLLAVENKQKVKVEEGKEANCLGPPNSSSAELREVKSEE